MKALLVFIVLAAGLFGGALLGWTLAYAAECNQPGQLIAAEIGGLAGLITCGILAAIMASIRKV